MKKLAAALTAAALLAPSASFAAGPTFHVTDVSTVPVPLAITSLEAAEDSSGVHWITTGAGQLELSLTCKGGARVEVAHEDGLVSYVRCDGKAHAAYRAKTTIG